MKHCLITGGTGFIGRHLVSELLDEGFRVTLLVRNPQSALLTELQEYWRSDQTQRTVQLVKFDLNQRDVDLTNLLNLSIYSDVYHLAAIYDLKASEQEMMLTNVEGTRRFIDDLQQAGFNGCFHYVSSIAVAGDYEGEFNESMFDEGQSHSHPYHKSKFEAEKIVRRYRDLVSFNIRIYRPSAVVGHSKSGFIDKLDGPYYLFILVSFLNRWLPGRLPLVLPNSKVVLDMVTVDAVASGIALISQLNEDELPNEQFCFHLSDPDTPSLTTIFGKLLSYANRSQHNLLVPVDFITKYGLAQQLKMLTHLQAFKLLRKEILKGIGVPEDVFDALMPHLKFDASLSQRILKKHGHVMSSVDQYLPVLWHYYDQHLVPEKNRTFLAIQAFKHKRVLITGGSSGIGLESAKKAYALGANVILVARDEQKLQHAVDEIKSSVESKSGELIYLACDLADLEACDHLVKTIIEQYGCPDIVFSNAGKSIRRSLSKSQGRFHDLERTMQLNYFGAARLIMGFMPSMIDQGGGHIIHSSSMGTLSPTPRFGPYMASKIALDALMDSMAAEFADRNILFSSIKFPLVQTPMVAPTKEFKQSKLTSPDQAAMMFINTVIDKNRQTVSATGKILALVNFVSPNFMTQLYNYGFKIWPDEEADFPEMKFDRSILNYFLPHSPL